MVSPHLPPEQSANALLPAMLGDALRSRGVATTYVSHPSAAPVADTDVGDITYVPRRGRGRFNRSKAGAVAAGMRMVVGATSAIRNCDVVHLHGNGFIVEVGQWLSRRHRKPYIVTLYGTDVSAHDPVRHWRFGQVVRSAHTRVFYSRGLLEQARRNGLAPDPSVVIYAPVGAGFQPPRDDERALARAALGLEGDPVLLTVKRLHPVGGHDVLLGAMPAILERFPAAILCLAGEGESRPGLEALCRGLGVAPHVRFVGRVNNDALRGYYAAADVFVLPSRVESWGTVMLESLACGTPVVTTDTMGGKEVGAIFPEDVVIVAGGNPEQLAAAVSGAALRRARASHSTLDRVQEQFSVAACASQYFAVYQRALTARHARAK